MSVGCDSLSFKNWWKDIDWLKLGGLADFYAVSKPFFSAW